ncbi:ABC-F family ATP-binding cassette domain-containing protein [Lactiplantibacillus mudanjiangensis]|uniref:Multidrug ABC transporter ATP-binding protein [Lactobacillus pentosus] n=1 Tax=Lactiplantibacillus mudanjiangensis TaxID=1296538 RepID=A0A660E6P1_9LACO|nr:ABC-F family ATP-binding cassette domain-containing protein [Lactiplantibacillus mudanjiangensis]VDG24278.1 multidrug ABC transporter ATP-binding protein [Lactobacillus pentosus] [Lactiplantibacillus mudanjiangensis]VDG30459.1 multidrug ABC transporter ATP-binding protein [Lactobacillus pentosus] [Lactiplantibacillus mudanjiangensis]
MQTLRAENLTRTYGEKTLFNDISFIVNEHDRIGVIGVNGSGKTNLLDVLAGVTAPEAGELIKPKNYEIGYLTQQPALNEELTVIDAVLAGSQQVFRTIRHYEQTLADFADNPEDPATQRAYSDAETKMNQEDAWNAESDVKTILTQLHITDLKQPVKTLSGGQRKRVGLAQVLIQSPDLLLLDEPTNHLDFDSIEWLETYLSSYKGALIVVTHDRYFLDQVANQMFELSFGELYKYTGNYQDYVQAKAERVARDITAEHKQQQLYKKELAWMRAGAPARSTKQQGRINRFNDLKGNLNTLQVDHDVDISLGQQRLGKKVIELKNASLTFDQQPILNDFSMLIQANDRIGITGLNGAGKSSLLNVIAGKLPLDSGTVTIGETVKMAYYTQQTEPIPGDKRIINYLQDVGETVLNKQGEHVSVTELLEEFLFPRSMHGTLIRKLSGGEKRRLYLLKLLMQQPNVLLLDEPTNDLDIGTLTVLENYLDNFVGTVITVSHDRYFLDKVGTKLLIFNSNGEIEGYAGRFSSYLEDQKESAAKATTTKTKAKTETEEPVAAKPKEKVKLTYAEQLEYDKIEGVIEKLDNHKSELEQAMADNASDYGKLADLQKDLTATETEIDEKMNRWDYLSQYAQA